MEGYETTISEVANVIPGIEKKNLILLTLGLFCTFLMDTLAWNRIKCLYQVRKELL